MGSKGRRCCGSTVHRQALRYHCLTFPSPSQLCCASASWTENFAMKPESSSALTTLIPRSEGQLTLSYAFKAHWDVHAAWTIALADHRIMQFYDVPDSVLMPAVTLAEEISPVPCGPVILLGYSVSEEKVEAREFCS